MNVSVLLDAFDYLDPVMIDRAAVWQENKPHLSAALAAGVAKEAGVKRLVLTHLNPAIPSAVLLREARDIFPAVSLASADSDWTV